MIQLRQSKHFNAFLQFPPHHALLTTVATLHTGPPNKTFKFISFMITVEDFWTLWWIVIDDDAKEYRWLEVIKIKGVIYRTFRN